MCNTPTLYDVALDSRMELEQAGFHLEGLIAALHIFSSDIDGNAPVKPELAGRFIELLQDRCRETQGLLVQANTVLEEVCRREREGRENG